MNTTIAYLHVFAISPCAAHGVLKLGNLSFPCLLGRDGRTFRKREGDTKTPRGRWLITQLYFRPDKFMMIKSAKTLKRKDGWCDAPRHRSYNHKVKLPFAASHEILWREDEAYDILATTNYNQRPRVRGNGSAIFLHIWREGATSTEGCIALRRRDLMIVLSKMKKTTYVVI